MEIPVTRVILRVVARPDTVGPLKTLLFELAAQSRNEDGCNAYKVFQSQTDPLEFACYASWASDAVLEAHMNTAHVAEAFEKWGPLLAEPLDRRVYTTIF
jgi:quinol monooxygenase YgiN